MFQEAMTRNLVANVLVLIGITLIYLIIFYVIVKAAVRNGTIEAHERMRLDDDESEYR